MVENEMKQEKIENGVENTNINFTDKVKDYINYNKKVVITFPDKVYRKLVDMSHTEANGCFWLMIEKALDLYNSQNDKDVNTIILMERDDLLRREIEDLRNRIDLIEKPVTKENKKGHFGVKKGVVE